MNYFRVIFKFNALLANWLIHYAEIIRLRHYDLDNRGGAALPQDDEGVVEDDCLGRLVEVWSARFWPYCFVGGGRYNHHRRWYHKGYARVLGGRRYRIDNCLNDESLCRHSVAIGATSLHLCRWRGC